MIIGAIIVGILICILIILSFHIINNSTEDFDIGFIIGSIITTLMVIGVSLLADIIGEPKPSAIDVYRGNTELEITSINGISTDTVVIFKKN